MLKKTLVKIGFGVAGFIATKAVIDKIEKSESKRETKPKNKNSKKKDEETKEVELSNELMEAVGFQTIEGVGY